MKLRLSEIINKIIGLFEKPAAKPIFGLLSVGLCLLYSANMVGAAALSTGYISQQKLPVGTIVSPDDQIKNGVIPANSQTSSNLLGVVVPSSTVAVSEGSGRVPVAADGNANVLVSDINGGMSRGDKVAASPLDGIGMLATKSGRIIGTLQGDLNSHSTDAQFKTITDVKGVKRKIQIALVPIIVSLTYYQPLDNQSTILPKVIRDISNSVSGKDVSTSRIWGAMVLMVAALTIVIVLLYGAVRSSIGAIGRNPLAKTTIQNSLTKVIAVVVVILIAATAASYVILRG
jgi:hypothetical protein